MPSYYFSHNVVGHACGDIKHDRKYWTRVGLPGHRNHVLQQSTKKEEGEKDLTWLLCWSHANVRESAYPKSMAE